MNTKQTITIEAFIQAPVAKIWELYTSPQHITQWNFASNDWHSPHAENSLTRGGRFNYRMEAIDKSFSFDFCGTFNKIIAQEFLSYTLDDGRIVSVNLDEFEHETRVAVEFEPEQQNSLDLQRSGWQAILNNFKNYVEKTS